MNGEEWPVNKSPRLMGGYMTEPEWSVSNDPEPLLAFLLGKSSDRKHCLFDAACCRRVWALLKEEETRKAITVLESYADDQTLWQEICEAHKRVDEVLTA
jgi:hypothetical protein